MRAKILSKDCTTAAGAYASGDIVGQSNKVANVLDTAGGSAMLKSITLISKIATAVAWDIYLFNDVPTIASADNAALDISDAEMASKLIGIVQLASTDSKASASNANGCKSNLNIPLKAVAGSKDIYAVIVVGGAWTAVGTTDVVIKLGVEL